MHTDFYTVALLTLKKPYFAPLSHLLDEGLSKGNVVTQENISVVT